MSTGAPAPADDEALAGRLRDLALVELDALGSPRLVAAYAEDVADALREARARIAALRGALGGADPLALVELPPRQRGSEAGVAGVDRARARLVAQADAARALARFAELAAALAPRLFEADRRHAGR